MLSPRKAMRSPFWSLYIGSSAATIARQARAANGLGRSWSVPAEWPQLVASQEPVVAVAFALGNFPQLVRNVQPLLTAVDLTRLRETANQPVNLPALLDWAASVNTPSQKLL